MIVYIVEHITWSYNEIEKIFFNKKKAEEFAEYKEKNKKESDGYVEYYVVEHEVEE